MGISSPSGQALLDKSQVAGQQVIQGEDGNAGGTCMYNEFPSVTSKALMLVMDQQVRFAED